MIENVCESSLNQKMISFLEWPISFCTHLKSFSNKSTLIFYFNMTAIWPSYTIIVILSTIHIKALIFTDSYRNNHGTWNFLVENVVIKGTLMQIWKSPYMFLLIQKILPWKFHILRIFELYTHNVCEMFVSQHTETIEYVKM